jgi:sialate O-acetylesterase
MQLTLRDTSDGAAAIAAANHPAIRLFNVNRSVAFKHQEGRLGIWAASSPQTIQDFSAAGYYFGLDLHQRLKVPIGLINSSWGGSQAEAWTPLEYLLASADLRPCVERAKIWDAERPKVKEEYEAKLSEWRVKSDAAKTQGLAEPPRPAVPDALRDYRLAASIYNGMIAPLIPFAIRGTIWYQGESNAERAQQYEILLPTMIRAWRERWGQGDFPFGIVQLPNYRAINPQPADEAWSHLREAQRRTAAKVPKAGLIVTIDIGEADNIHPKNKLEVGKRMSRWALVDAYHHKSFRSGPLFRKAKASQSKMVLTFAEAGRGLKIRNGNELHEFAIAGTDRVWHWGAARITGKDRLEVWSDAVPQPVAVRYAFNNNPESPNLTNETGLPAAPFRTDDWPGPTDGKR